MKKVIAFLLIAAMALTFLASCDNGNNTPSDDTRTKGNDDLAREVDDEIPAGTTFNNETIYFLIEGSEDKAIDYFRESLTNDLVNDAIYNRNIYVADRLKVNLKYITTDDPTDTASTSILSMLDEYQIVADDSISLVASAQNHYYLDVNSGDLTYLNLEHAWWNSYIAENASIYGKLYTFTGDLSLSIIKKSFATFFNRELLTVNGITEDLYKTVDQGRWTIDHQKELISGIYSDVTGDGQSVDDIYGLTIDNVCCIDAYWSAFDISLMQRTDDGGIAFYKEMPTKITDALEKLYALMYENKDVFVVDGATYDTSGLQIGENFSLDQSLFATLRIGNCERENMRNMKSDYGIIPMPKWDESQDKNYTYVQDGYVVYAFPNTVKNKNAASAVIEALGSYTYAHVAPAYYNNVLKGRYLRELEASKMIDMITENIKLDYTWIHTFALNKVAQESFRQILFNKGSNFKTYWRGNKGIYNKALDKLLADYQKED